MQGKESQNCGMEILLREDIVAIQSWIELVRRDCLNTKVQYYCKRLIERFDRMKGRIGGVDVPH